MWNLRLGFRAPSLRAVVEGVWIICFACTLWVEGGGGGGGGGRAAKEVKMYLIYNEEHDFPELAI